MYKTKCKQTAMEAEKPETITLRLPRLYILVHNRNRVENAHDMTPLFTLFNDFKQLPTQRDTDTFTRP